MVTQDTASTLTVLIKDKSYHGNYPHPVWKWWSQQDKKYTWEIPPCRSSTQRNRICRSRHPLPSCTVQQGTAYSLMNLWRICRVISSSLLYPLTFLALFNHSLISLAHFNQLTLPPFHPTLLNTKQMLGLETGCQWRLGNNRTDL